MCAIIDASQYSHIQRLTAVTSYVLRFVNNLHKGQSKVTGPLTVTELDSSYPATMRCSTSQLPTGTPLLAETTLTVSHIS